jgi:hypothetical protein
MREHISNTLATPASKSMVTNNLHKGSALFSPLLARLSSHWSGDSESAYEPEEEFCKVRALVYLL